jgi:multiple sugar transport system permease protein
MNLITLVVVILVIAVIVVFDIGIFTNVLTSFKSDADISSTPPRWIFSPVLTHYYNLFVSGAYDFPRYLLNSLIIALASTTISILITLPAAYSIVRYRGFGEVVLGATLLLRLMPALSMAIPMYVIFNYFGLIDTHIAIILMHALFIAPTSLLLLIGYVQDLPKEIEEAAEIDGANVWQVLWNVLLPVIRPGVAAVAILGFVTSWNEFLFSNVLSIKKVITATVGTSYFITSYAVKWGDMAAAITVSTIPTLIFIFIAQKSLIKGMTAGAVKE